MTTSAAGHASPLDEAALEQLFTGARTPNAFTDEPVTDEQLQALYDLVKWAPTSMNNQPLRVLAVRSPEARERLAAAMMPGNRDKTLAAPLTLVLAADTDFHEHMPHLYPAYPDAQAMFAGDDTMREGAARLNAALQIGYWILGVRALGLAAGPMTGLDTAAVDREFFPDGAHRTLVVMNIGTPVPESAYPRGPRLTQDEVITTV